MSKIKPWMIIVAVVLVLYFIGSCQGGGSTTSYYSDYNNNGNMDKGEFSHYEDSDGSTHWDSNGDGWVDYDIPSN